MENVLDPGSWHMNAVRKFISGQIHWDHEFFREDFSHGRRGNAIAHRAIERKCGARGLKAIMEEFLMKIMYELPDKNGVNECIIDRQTVLTGEAKYCSNGKI